LVPLTQTSQEAEHWQALEMHNLLLINIWYTQAGILLPSKADKPKVRVQPLSFTYKNFDALDKSSTQFDLGTNFFLDGQHAKITAQYSARPVYTTPSNTSGSKGEFIVQLQIYL
jgi:hypothetical protein